MVSYYNHPLASMYQKNPNGGSHLPYTPSTAAWYASNYHHQPPNAQFLGDAESHSQSVYYPHMFHQSSPDWPGHDSYTGPPQTGSILQGPGSGNHGGPAGFLSINQAMQNGNIHNEHINDGLQSMPSPPITVSGSDMSSPGANNGSTSPHSHSRPTPVKSPYEWMKKPSYQSQPNPGKTRTKDKYRVVYTDHQRLELEKEFHYTRYITIRRKSELAQTLTLSERQVKIWFQNRRAKDRKQKKKMDSGSTISSVSQSMLPQPQNGINTSSSSNLTGFHDVKPKMDPSIHLQHLHQITAMGFGYDKMGLHAHHALNSHHLTQQQLPPTSMNQQLTNSQSSSAPSPSMMMN